MKRIVILIIIILVGIGASIGLVYFSNLQKPQENSVVTEEKGEEEALIVTVADPNSMSITFSHSETFYDKPIDVEIKCSDKNASIYYTTDGSTPDENATVYKEPISISAEAEVKAKTLKVIAINGDEKTGVVTKSYVTGSEVFSRFTEDTYVFVLSTDPYNLYDYYYGVAVEGAIRDEYLSSDEYNGVIQGDTPANWTMRGRDSERDMYVEAYNNTGEQLINQAAGGRVVGGWSRADSQKSWRLFARNEYSEGNGMFSYPFFSGAVDAYGQLLTKFDRITLRNCANDREYAGVRDEIALQLSHDAGFPDTQETHPAAVFLNGEYYGFAWLHEAYCNGYLEQTYGGEKDNFRIVSDKESEVTGDDEKSVADYQHVFDLACGGLTDNARFEEFCSLVDIDNLMLYYAIQIYIDNKDWPGNNFRAWRYYPSENEEVTSEYLDGKWRYMLFDVEFAMGLYENGYSDDTLSNVLSGINHMKGDSKVLKALLERQDMKEKFSNTMCDLISGSFSTENALRVMEEKIALCDAECFYALDNGYTSDWANRDTFADSRNQIKEFFVNRPRIVMGDLADVVGVENKTYSATLENTDGGRVKLNSQYLTVSGNLSGNYYTAYSVPISAEAYNSYEFSHWEINGVSYRDKNMNINASYADADGSISIKAVYSKLNIVEPLYIGELYTAGKGDWFTLTNPNNIEISTKDYYLSDNEAKLNKWKIPTALIPAGSSLTIVCKNNTEASALHKLVTNFSLKAGETLYLSDSNGKIISQVAVVDMNENECLIRGLDGTYSIKPLPTE